MRRKLAVLTLILVFIAAIVSCKELLAVTNPEMPGRYTLHYVQKGETLWEISKQYMPQVDPRIGVQWIRECNGMPRNYVLQHGDLINVPDPNGNMLEPYGQD